jgi:hypothetical protein
VGPYLLTKLLVPILIKTALTPKTPKNSVRVVFVVALIQRAAPFELRSDDNGVPLKLGGSSLANYFQSRVGVTWLATLFADRLQDKNIMSLVRDLFLTPKQTS